MNGWERRKSGRDFGKEEEKEVGHHFFCCREESGVERVRMIVEDGEDGV